MLMVVIRLRAFVKKIKKRLLARKDSGVVGQGGNGAVAVDKKDDRGVEGDFAA